MQIGEFSRLITIYIQNLHDQKQFYDQNIKIGNSHKAIFVTSKHLKPDIQRRQACLQTPINERGVLQTIDTFNDIFFKHLKLNQYEKLVSKH